VKPTEARQVILRPVVTEKSLRTSERCNAYTFEVHVKANKVQIRTAVESIFNVSVVGVRTDLRAGKPRRRGYQAMTTPARKRAIVTLKEGQTIDVY
jgi:large subunit ribosomal protein L23